jgi:hypothetical protein
VAFHAASAHEALADVSATVALCQALRRRSPGHDPFIPVEVTSYAGEAMVGLETDSKGR